MIDQSFRNIPVTLALIALSVLATLLVGFGDNWRVLQLLMVSDSTRSLTAVENYELWRLITPSFIHFSIYHLVFNLLWILIFGRIIELIEGGKTLLAIFIVASAVSAAAEFYFSGPHFGGMSGVVYALAGYFWMQSIYNRGLYGRLLPPAIIPLMLIWFVICWTGLIGGIANVAHTAGLVVGILWGRIHTLRLSRHA